MREGIKRKTQQRFYASPVQFLPALAFATLTLGGLSFGGIQTFEPINIILAMIPLALLAGCYWFVWRQTHGPVVVVEGCSVRVRGSIGKDYLVADVREFMLVLNSDWIGFRKNHEQDIMLDRARFNRATWTSLCEELRLLPFANMIDPRAEQIQAQQ